MKTFVTLLLTGAACSSVQETADTSALEASAEDESPSGGIRTAMKGLATIQQVVQKRVTRGNDDASSEEIDEAGNSFHFGNVLTNKVLNRQQHSSAEDSLSKTDAEPLFEDKTDEGALGNLVLKYPKNGGTDVDANSGSNRKVLGNLVIDFSNSEYGEMDPETEADANPDLLGHLVIDYGENV